MVEPSVQPRRVSVVFMSALAPGAGTAAGQQRQTAASRSPDLEALVTLLSAELIL